MNLYLISQTENNGWDTFDSAVVAAECTNDARNLSPSGSFKGQYPKWCSSSDQVSVEYIGVAKEETVAGIVLSSFNAG